MNQCDRLISASQVAGPPVNAGDCMPRGRAITAISLVSPSWAWRHGVQQILARRYPAVPVANYASIVPPASPVPIARGHVAILDGMMGYEHTRDWIRFCNRCNPRPQSLVLDVLDDTDLIFSYIMEGISGYTLLGSDDMAASAALDDIRHGVAHCSPELVSRLFAMAAAPQSARAPAPSLTAREFEVLRHLANERSNQEIADLLTVELCTVKHHVHNVLRKLNVRHRWDAARIAVSEGWLEHQPYLAVDNLHSD